MSNPQAELEMLNGRYRVLEAIARGAQGRTSRAVDEQTGATVVLKELDFAGVGDWDEVALFERESAVLAGLDNAAIPRFLDTFKLDDGLRLFLVQEFVDGEDLQVRLDRGQLFDEARLKEIASSVLETLIYLHGHSPPVIHRDIKPANLIARPAGGIALVDFGAAQGHAHGTAVIGTTGYMPAEQLMGRALPVSDLFALGATLVHLATRQHPSDLGDGLGLKWRDRANLTPRLEEWLDRLIAPMPEDRFLSAVAAKRALGKLDQRHNSAVEPWREHSSSDLVEGAEDGIAPRSSHHSKVFDVRVAGSNVSLARRGKRHQLDSLNIALVIVALALAAVHPALGLAVIFVILFSAYLQEKAVLQLHGHDRGLDIVWSGNDEVVQRVGLDGIAGAEVRGIVLRSLVLWRRDGSKIVLDYAMGDRDLEAVRAAVHRWLIHVREHR